MERKTVNFINLAEHFGFISDLAGKELFEHFCEIKANCIKSLEARIILSAMPSLSEEFLEGLHTRV